MHYSFVFNDMVGNSDYTVLTFLLLSPSIAAHSVSVNTQLNINISINKNLLVLQTYKYFLSRLEID